MLGLVLVMAACGRDDDPDKCGGRGQSLELRTLSITVASEVGSRELHLYDFDGNASFAAQLAPDRSLARIDFEPVLSSATLVTAVTDDDVIVVNLRGFDGRGLDGGTEAYDVAVDNVGISWLGASGGATTAGTMRITKDGELTVAFEGPFGDAAQAEVTVRLSEVSEVTGGCV